MPLIRFSSIQPGFLRLVKEDGWKPEEVIVGDSRDVPTLKLLLDIRTRYRSDEITPEYFGKFPKRFLKSLG